MNTRLYITVATIVWEFDVYEFDEGGIYNICAVTNDTIEGSRTERRRVEFKNGTAIGMEFGLSDKHVLALCPTF